MDDDDSFLSRCYHVKCPVFGENDRLRLQVFREALYLLPDRLNREAAAADERYADVFLSLGNPQFCCHQHAYRKILDAGQPEDKRILEAMRREYPQYAHEPDKVLSFRLEELNPPLYASWEFNPGQAARFERMGYDQKCAGIITPTPAEMYAHFYELQKAHFAQKQKWIALFGDKPEVTESIFDALMSGKEQMANNFLVGGDDKVWMEPAWLRANDLAMSHDMYEIVKELSNTGKSRFNFNIPGTSQSLISGL